MAQGRLISFAAGAAVLTGGAAAEIIAGSSLATALLDWVVGAAFVAAALPVRGRSGVAVGLVTGAAWFLASLPAAGAIVVLAYRGPLLHWLVLRIRANAATRVLIVVGYGVALTGTIASAAATAAAATSLAATVLWTSRYRPRPADLRAADFRTVTVLVLLACLWAVTAAGVLPAQASQVLTAATMVAVAWHLSRPGGGAALSDAVGTLVLELGPASRSSSPLAASLARVLADPDLRVRAYQPETGWTDELGRLTTDPLAAGGALTDVAAPGGGRVVLIHGPSGSGDTELARAAAGAAALALDSVRVEAQVRRQAEQVRKSSARLLTIDDAQRETLAQRLRRGPLARLEKIRLMLDQVAPVHAELDRVIDELDRLAQGLNPIALRVGSLAEALTELIARSGLPAHLDLHGTLAALPEDTTALVYFVAAECLTNIARHAQATWVSITVCLDQTLTVEITDNGRGGATTTAGRGLQGLTDRVAVAAGTLDITSPAGGPTRIHAEIPLP